MNKLLRKHIVTWMRYQKEKAKAPYAKIKTQVNALQKQLNSLESYQRDTYQQLQQPNKTFTGEQLQAMQIFLQQLTKGITQTHHHIVQLNQQANQYALNYHRAAKKCDHISELAKQRQHQYEQALASKQSQQVIESSIIKKIVSPPD